MTDLGTAIHNATPQGPCGDINTGAPAQAHLTHNRNTRHGRRRNLRTMLHIGHNTRRFGTAWREQRRTETMMHGQRGPTPALHATPLPTKRYEMRNNYGLRDYIGCMVGIPLHMPARIPTMQPPPRHRMRPTTPLALPRPTLPSGRVGRSPHAPPPLFPMRERGVHPTLGRAQ